DHLLAVDGAIIADFLLNGHLKSALRQAKWRARRSQQSLWRILYRYAIAPNLPRTIQQRRLLHHRLVPRWLRTDFVEKFDLANRSAAWQKTTWKRHEREQARVHDMLARLNAIVSRPSPLPGLLELRFPFVYRPLCELSMALPPQLCRAELK